MADESKIDIKEIHQTFWRCRDFELSNLWQRSIFLTAFLVLCFTAYGSVLVKLFDPTTTSFNSILVFNIAEFALALLGIVFSVLWVKMGKGSKAWYEVYESAISALETNEDYTTKQAAKIGGFSYATLPGYRGVHIDNNLFSTKAGEFSVSKLNIAIGQVFMVVWSVIAIVHVVAVSLLLSDRSSLGYFYVIAAAIGLLLLGSVLFVFSRSRTFKSGSMKWFKKPNKKEENEK